MNKTIKVLTRSGKEKLEKELEFLKTERRSEIAEKIKVALSFGDLSENSEYDEAKNEQGILESRIAEIEAILAHSRIIEDDEISTEKVSVGNVVKFQDTKTNEVFEFHIVSTNEFDISKGKMSDEAPIGAALIGAEVDDVVDVETPNGAVQYRVLEITRKEEE